MKMTERSSIGDPRPMVLSAVPPSTGLLVPSSEEPVVEVDDTPSPPGSLVPPVSPPEASCKLR